MESTTILLVMDSVGKIWPNAVKDTGDLMCGSIKYVLSELKQKEINYSGIDGVDFKTLCEFVDCNEPKRVEVDKWINLLGKDSEQQAFFTARLSILISFSFASLPELFEIMKRLWLELSSKKLNDLEFCEGLRLIGGLCKSRCPDSPDYHVNRTLTRGGEKR
ncbi:hypothetical protein HK096_008277 [Nowakowskiella sp. JEL0078]|nr:hypothetical protein HK096_008277 [Nowakowskiella sp. JEL0078]